MAPAHQRFEPRHTATREVDLRLIVHRQPDILADGVAQFACQLGFVLHGGVEVGLEKRKASASILLGTVEGKIGVAQKIARCGAITWNPHDPDACFYADLTPFLEMDRA